MPKKQKQKQKQTQVTKVSVKIGDTNKPKRQTKPRAKTVPVPQRASSGIALTLQGSSVAFPTPPTQQYNELVQQVEALRRQMAQSGSLIPRGATNDLLNRVQATNPFDNIANIVPVATLMRPEGVVEEMVEGATTIDPTESHGFAVHQAYDQDWIRNVELAKRAQNFDTVATKIGISNEDPETVKDISNFDGQADYYQRQILKTVLGTEDLETWNRNNKLFAEELQQKLNAKKLREAQFRESQARFSMTAQDIFSKQMGEQDRRQQELSLMTDQDVRERRSAMSKKQRAMGAVQRQVPEQFSPSGTNPKGRPKKVKTIIDESQPFEEY